MLFVLGCFDRLWLGRWVSATKRLDRCSYRSVVGPVGALEELEGICGHFCLEVQLACVAWMRYATGGMG
jgi:hypothetical protein